MNINRLSSQLTIHERGIFLYKSIKPLFRKQENKKMIVYNSLSCTQMDDKVSAKQLYSTPVTKFEYLTAITSQGTLKKYRKPLTTHDCYWTTSILFLNIPHNKNLPSMQHIQWIFTKTLIQPSTTHLRPLNQPTATYPYTMSENIQTLTTIQETTPKSSKTQTWPILLVFGGHH